MLETYILVEKYEISKFIPAEAFIAVLEVVSLLGQFITGKMDNSLLAIGCFITSFYHNSFIKSGRVISCVRLLVPSIQS